MRHVHFDLVDSTNTQARRLAAQHPGERVLVTAAEQTAGRGRLGRDWQSPRGGAWLSLAWPMHNAPCTYAAASLVAAVAVVRAVSEVVPECAGRLQVKWPNDLLLSGRKVAGILCEQALGGIAESPATLVVGVGVNVDFDVALFPTELRHPATTLQRESIRPVMVEQVVNAVAACLVELLTEFEADGLSEELVEELRGRLAYVGTVRSFEQAGRVVTGSVMGIDGAGRLVIQNADGEKAFAAGELIAHAADADLNLGR